MWPERRRTRRSLPPVIPSLAQAGVGPRRQHHVIAIATRPKRLRNTDGGQNVEREGGLLIRGVRRGRVVGARF